MSFSYGFYNSINHDRKYNSLQISKIFDGIINDGVYATLGEAFIIKESPDQEIENMVIIGSGRGWFDHTWNYNDADLPLELEPSEIALDRIDAVILDINSHDDYRQNDIIVIKGDPSNTPERPELIKDEYHKQYPLAYIYRREKDDKIRQADITNMVGTSECPFVTGIIETINIDLLLMQWRDEWQQFVTKYGDDVQKWTDEQMADFTQWSINARLEFVHFMENLSYVLDGDVAGHLQNEINHVATYRVDAVFRASNWVGEESPFTYEMYFPWITESNKIDFITPSSDMITKEQITVYMSANIVTGKQEVGKMTIYAYGKKPEIDLPVTILFRGIRIGDPGTSTDDGIMIKEVDSLPTLEEMNEFPMIYAVKSSIKDNTFDLYRRKGTNISKYIYDDVILFNTEQNLTDEQKAQAQENIGIGGINEHLAEVENIAKGASKSFVFDSVADMETWIKDVKNKNKADIGNDFLIKELKVPDYWVSAVYDTPDASGNYYEVSESETKAQPNSYFDEELISSNWVGGTAPYVYTLDISADKEITNDSYIAVTIPEGINGNQITAYEKAKISSGSLSTNKIIINAWGIKPSINLPIQFIKFGK